MIDEHVGTDVAVCPACGEHNPSVAAYCMSCGTRMSVDEGERRILTVMFADLNGFMSHAETVTPEDLQRLADTTTGRLIGIVQRFGGSLDKIIGENGLKVMALFGAPVAHEDDPERAVHAALAMQEDAAADPQEYAGLRLSIGIHTGEVIYAPVGPGGGYTVLGDTVNTAARLMAAAAAGETLLGEAAARDVASIMELDEIPPLVVKNKREPVPAWRALGLRGEPARRRLTRTPLVGRDVELERLDELWQRARAEHRPQLCALIGAAGLGKTRLIETFHERSASDALVVTGHCLSYGEGITYWPIIEAIKDLAGIRTSDAPDVVSVKLGDLLEALGVDDLDQLRTIAVAVANLVASPRTPRGTYSAEKISKHELHWGIRRLLQLFAEQQPMLLVIEDLHWAEATLLELLEFILAGSEPASILLIATARPELKDHVPPLLDPKMNRRILELEPLADEDAADLVARLVGDAGRDAMGALLSAAAGNPLFLEEIVQMLADTGMIDADGRPTGRLDAMPVPDSLQSLIDARLDRLAAREKRVAGRAAVVGPTFWAGAVARLDPDADVERALATLIDKDIIVPVEPSSIDGEREYVFKHVMLRDVAYERIPKVDRAGLHRRCGGWIGELPGEEEYVEIVAYHLEQAVRLAADVGARDVEAPVLAAVRALRRAGQKAEGRDGTAEADRYYARALELVGDRYPETATELRAQRTRTTTLLGRHRDAVLAWSEVAEEASATGRPDLRCQALLAIGNVLGQAGQLDRARPYLDEAAQIATAMGDRESQLSLSLINGNFRLMLQGDPGGLDDLRAALDIAEDVGRRELLATALAQIGTAYLNLGRPAEAEEPFVRCAEVAAELGSVRWEAVALASLGMIRYFRGPRDEAAALCLQALELLKRSPQFLTQVQTLKHLGLLALARRDAHEGERWFRDALALAARAGSWEIVEMQRGLAEALAWQGKVEDAAASAATAAEHAGEVDHPYVKALAAIADAFAALAAGDAGRVRARFDEALPLLDAPGMEPDLAKERISYGRALAHLGDAVAAAAALDAARAEFDAMGARAMVDEIDAIRAG